MIASDQESFVTLSTDYETALEMLEGIPSFAKIEIPQEVVQDASGDFYKMELPVNIVVYCN